MKKAIVVTILGLLVITGLLGGIKFSQILALINQGESFSEPPISISSFEVKQDQWENTLTAISSLEAAKGLMVTADLPGRIAKIHFDAGSEVKAGDLLIEQDVSSEKAELRSARASAKLAKIQLKRVRELHEKKAASSADLDSARSNYDAAVAHVDNTLATIKKKSIRAPFDGRLGIRLVNLGQIINAGEPVVSLQSTHHMFANFSLPQQHLSKLAENLPVRLTTDAIPGKQFSGFISTIDPEIEASTRSIKLQATVTNAGNELLPGIFATIEVVLPDPANIVIIPITAVQYATFGDSVFVIEGEKKLIARQQFVKLGKTRGDYVVVAKGLSVGQKIVGMGVFKLRNGAPVTINDAVIPEYSLTPVVTDQ